MLNCVDHPWKSHAWTGLLEEIQDILTKDNGDVDKRVRRVEKELGPLMPRLVSDVIKSSLQVVV